MSSDKTAKRKGKPRGRPFVAGQSGNPKGRRPIPDEVREIFLAADEKAARKIVQLIDDIDPEMAFKAACKVHEVNHGKAPQPLTGADGEALTIIIHRSGDAH